MDDLTETPLKYTSDELLAKVRTENPEIVGNQEIVRKESLNIGNRHKDRYPDFSVQYINDATCRLIP